MYIEIKNAVKTFYQKGKEFTALDNVSLSIEKGEFICLLGPSGCGKSTLLNAIAGFDTVSNGSITIEGKEVKEPSRKNVTIFQNYGLFPWRTVEKNVELGLEAQKYLKMNEKKLQKNILKWLDFQNLRRLTQNSFLVVCSRELQ